MEAIEVKQKSGKILSKKSSVRVDMTPMVDLGFLLITFFMFTTNFSKPNVIDLGLPGKGDIVHDVPLIDVKNSIVFIMGKDNRIFYHQEEKNNLNENSLKEISFNNAMVSKTIETAKQAATNKDGFTVIIKPTDDANYKNFVDILDELAITKNQRYGVTDINEKEKEIYNLKIN